MNERPVEPGLTGTTLANSKERGQAEALTAGPKPLQSGGLGSLFKAMQDPAKAMAQVISGSGLAQ